MTLSTASDGKSVAAVLARVRVRIHSHSAWTAGTWARDQRGQSVHPRHIICTPHPDAAAWDLVGALVYELEWSQRGTTRLFDAALALLAVTARRRFPSVTTTTLPAVSLLHAVNDAQEHSAILSLLDDAIAQAERGYLGTPAPHDDRGTA